MLYIVLFSSEQIEKRAIYCSTKCMKFSISSLEAPTSKKSSITVVRTPPLAHDIRASDSSGEKRVAAPEK